MIFLMTKDSFLLQGFWQLKDNHENDKNQFPVRDQKSRQ
ncbi:DNA-binding transcriptional activator [Escherichia coli]|uniref:DNA-binding transcriptional activator n=1 Tax=Escherichia coli TaxID=562 RepID=A0A377ALB5_ECOLX|nr:DNA-binding transcriptional activator [Escherichia coli]